MTTDLQEAYDAGVLVPEVHSRLVANIDQFAQQAGITEDKIMYRMSRWGCTTAEIDYVRSIRRRASMGMYGLIYHGPETIPLTQRMSAVAGACLRNFVEAKVMVLHELLDCLKEGDNPDISVLLVPNFFIPRSDGGKIGDWQISELLGFLYSRMVKGQQTFLYVSSFDGLKKAYGEPMANHLKEHFATIAA